MSSCPATRYVQVCLRDCREESTKTRCCETEPFKVLNPQRPFLRSSPPGTQGCGGSSLLEGQQGSGMEAGRGGHGQMKSKEASRQ